MKYYPINRFILVKSLHVATLSGFDSENEAELAGKETAEKWKDQVFVKVVKAANINDAKKIANT